MADALALAPQTEPIAPVAASAMLDAAEPLAGTHAMVIGHDTLDVLCGLIGRGCGAAVETTLGGHLPAEPTEIVLVPRIDSLHEVHQAIALARRALLPCGRIVLRHRDGSLATAIARMLRAAGFSAVRVQAQGMIVTGDWPMFGLHTGAAHA